MSSEEFKSDEQMEKEITKEQFATIQELYLNLVCINFASLKNYADWRFLGDYSKKDFITVNDWVLCYFGFEKYYNQDSLWNTPKDVCVLVKDKFALLAYNNYIYYSYNHQKMEFIISIYETEERSNKAGEKFAHLSDCVARYKFSKEKDQYKASIDGSVLDKILELATVFNQHVYLLKESTGIVVSHEKRLKEESASKLEEEIKNQQLRQAKKVGEQLF